jgi:2-oxoglutarate dehydrogenase E1 component
MEFKTVITYGFANLPLLEEIYAKYVENPTNVDASWRSVFQQLEEEAVPQKPQAIAPISREPLSVVYPVHPPKTKVSALLDVRVYHLIEAYRTFGHLMAKVNPIATHEIQEPYQLQLEALGFTKQDLSAYFPTYGLLPEETAPLLEIINTLKAIYCDKIGIEYMEQENLELESWLQRHIEPTRFKAELTMHQKQMILQHLNKSELFESFLHTKYVGQKRFSLEGCETLIPMLAAIIDTGAELGLEEFVLGMAHRGRINVLCNILDKSYTDIFFEFEEGYIPVSVEGSGDVKYHKGFFSDVKTVHGHQVKVDLPPNPSHLESVDPVVEGQVLAKQVMRGDEIRHEKVIPILMHGDAAIAGQGVVYETLQLYKLEGYSTGGTIHIVINNQIGFTTLPKDGRSTFYCTDIARAFGAPIFHVNAEDPEGCVYVTNLAVQLRQKFHCDVFIDLNCYRKYGHNEADEPAFTQPLEYQLIRKKKPIREIYRDALIHQGIVEKYMAESLEDEFKKGLQEALKLAKTPSQETTAKETSFPPADIEREIFQHWQTGVPKQILQQIGQRICAIPEDLTIHPKLNGLLKERLAMLTEGEGARPIDWGMGELLAYGSLLWEGTPIRLSGQDSCRGTFSHRHAMFMDQVKEQGYISLQHLKPDQGRFDIYNSPLSEYAVLGFEFGYSSAYPEALVIWEAQFGDFCNGGQVVIDQFISSGEQKWGLKLNLTLFLPHGYEGQGPEHSSARIERFLTLSGDYNMQVVNPTTPAQLFHLLRRQVMRPLRKPLIVFTPKGLLRHHACVSTLSDLTQGSFQELLDDANAPQKPKKLVLCSGRIYYDLIAERAKTQGVDMAIIRIEQLYPLDLGRLKQLIEKYQGFQECYWVQEEPSNMGAWNYIRPFLYEVLPNSLKPNYIGRERSASPAVGSHALHKQEHAAIIDALFGKKEKSIFEIAGQKTQ